MSAALRVLAEHGLAEHGPEGWRRGPARLDYVAESTNAAQLHREWAAAYAKQREKWRGLIGSWLPQRCRARAMSDPCALASTSGSSSRPRGSPVTRAPRPAACWHSGQVTTESSGRHKVPVQ